MLRIRWTRALGLLAAAALLLPLLGCDYVQQVEIKLTDFDTSQVQGVSLWRLDPDTGTWQRRYEIHFGSTYVKDGVEYVDYTLLDASGAEFGQVPAVVARDPAQPGSAELQLAFFVYDPPSTYKVAAFNALGESALSANSLVMDGA